MYEMTKINTVTDIRAIQDKIEKTEMSISEQKNSHQINIKNVKQKLKAKS